MFLSILEDRNACFLHSNFRAPYVLTLSALWHGSGLPQKRSCHNLIILVWFYPLCICSSANFYIFYLKRTQILWKWWEESWAKMLLCGCPQVLDCSKYQNLVILQCGIEGDISMSSKAMLWEVNCFSLLSFGFVILVFLIILLIYLMH